MNQRALFALPIVLAVMAIVAHKPERQIPARQVLAAPPSTDAAAPRGPIGLSLFFRNSAMKPINLVGTTNRYFHEIDVVASTDPSPVDDGINPLIHTSEFASLDWTGITQVDEDWRKNTDGTYQRERFYRGAAWMNAPSTFRITPTDDAGKALGAPLTVNAGSEGVLSENEDGFVRRFVARQIASGCKGLYDTTGATFTTQALAQVRDQLHPERQFAIPAKATHLRLDWNLQPTAHRVVALTRTDPKKLPYGYGFQINLTPTPPANGTFYKPGETFKVRITFTDGQGNRLHPPGSLPTYAEFIANDGTAPGIRYINFGFNTTLYYALKHRESTMLLGFDGPVDKLKQSTQAIDLGSLFVGQGVGATTADDGYSAGFIIVPPITTLVDPSKWTLPVPDTYPLTIPADALPGTYVIVLKARREFGGESVNRAKTVDIQVGTTSKSVYAPRTGKCNDCHEEQSRFANVLHGLEDMRACYTCHASLQTEPDNALDIRVHTIHDRSARFRSLEGGLGDCTLCHFTPPAGPARGMLNPGPGGGGDGGGDGGGTDNAMRVFRRR